MVKLFFATDAGTAGLVFSSQGLKDVLLPPVSEPVTNTHDSSQKKLIQDIQSYFRGEVVDFSQWELDLSGATPFQKRVYAALLQIPWGETLTYAELAKQIGSPGAYRAVGTALAKNPIPLVIPCHRVVAANGKLGGFSGPGGLRQKIQMLQLEKVDCRRFL